MIGHGARPESTTWGHAPVIRSNTSGWVTQLHDFLACIGIRRVSLGAWQGKFRGPQPAGSGAPPRSPGQRPALSCARVPGRVPQAPHCPANLSADAPAWPGPPAPRSRPAWRWARGGGLCCAAVTGDNAVAAAF